MRSSAEWSAAYFMSKASNTFKETVDNATRYTQSVIDDFRASDIPALFKEGFQGDLRFLRNRRRARQNGADGTVQEERVFHLLHGSRTLSEADSGQTPCVVLMAAFLAWGGLSGDGGESFLAFLILLFLLGLELKDKTVAKDELQEGRAVQLAIMPVANPSLDGWELWFHSSPANDVGGDLVDHLELDDNRLAVTLGDVAGIGLPGAPCGQDAGDNTRDCSRRE